MSGYFDDDVGVRRRVDRYRRSLDLRCPERLRWFFATADVSGQLTTGAVRHNLLAGTDYYNRRYFEDGIFVDPFSTSNGLFPSPIDIFNPVYGYDKAAVLDGQPRASFQTSDDWMGFYAQDQLTLGAARQWHVLVGGGFDHARSRQSRNPERDTDVQTNDDTFSPRVGALYQPIPQVAVFANNARAFGGPNIGVSAVDGSALPSRTSRQSEAGVKFQLYGQRVSGSAVYFHLTKENIAQPLSVQPGSPSDVSGEARSRGFELDVLGQLSDTLSISATYPTRTDAEYTEDLRAQGNRLPNVADHMGSLWMQYRLDIAGLRGAGVAAGIFMMGDRAGDRPNSFVMPGYARVDLAGTYRFRAGQSAMVAQLNVENLFDKEYFLSADGRPLYARIGTAPWSGPYGARLDSSGVLNGAAVSRPTAGNHDLGRLHHGIGGIALLERQTSALRLVITDSITLRAPRRLPAKCRRLPALSNANWMSMVVRSNSHAVMTICLS